MKIAAVAENVVERNIWGRLELKGHFYQKWNPAVHYKWFLVRVVKAY